LGAQSNLPELANSLQIIDLQAVLFFSTSQNMQIPGIQIAKAMGAIVFHHSQKSPPPISFGMYPEGT
jgi:hypothetical protein